jgi:hypothetical protein
VAVDRGDGGLLEVLEQGVGPLEEAAELRLPREEEPAALLRGRGLGVPGVGPAERTGGAPVTITTRVDASSRSSANAAPRSVSMSSLSELRRSGRSSVTVAIAPSRVRRTLPAKAYPLTLSSPLRGEGGGILVGQKALTAGADELGRPGVAGAGTAVGLDRGAHGAVEESGGRRRRRHASSGSRHSGDETGGDDGDEDSHGPFIGASPRSGAGLDPNRSDGQRFQRGGHPVCQDGKKALDDGMVRLYGGGLAGPSYFTSTPAGRQLMPRGTGSVCVTRRGRRSDACPLS